MKNKINYKNKITSTTGVVIFIVMTLAMISTAIIASNFNPQKEDNIYNYKDVIGYVRGWSNYSNRVGLMGLIDTDDTPRTYDNNYTIPTPADGQMTDSYILQSVKSAVFRIKMVWPVYCYSYEYLLATEPNIADNFKNGDVSPTSSDGPAYVDLSSGSWSIISRSSNYVTLSVTYQASSSSILNSSYGTYDEVYFDDGMSTHTYTLDVRFTDPAPNSISVSSSSISMTEKETVSIGANVVPSNAFSKQLTYSSNNSTVATVDAYGNVTAKKAGTATITITESYTGISTSVKVTVQSAEIAANSLSFTSNSLDVVKGNTATISYVINPSNATDKNITWTSSNNSIASVSNGIVTGKGMGSATITGTLKNGVSASCRVNVLVLPESITIIKNRTKLEVGETETYSVSFTPAKVSDPSITWTSSDNSIASVNSNGTVTAKGKGNAIITAKTSNGKTDKFTVVVLEAAPTGVSLDKTSLSMESGNSVSLSATIKPSTVTDTLTWSSSNTTVASVSATGIVKAIKAGTATITVATSNGYTATCQVTVTSAITSVTLNKTSIALSVNETEKLAATIAPTDATDKTLTWSSSNTAVATVSNGTITAKTAGTATITVKTTNGKTATCTVTVKEVEADSVKLSASTTTLKVGDTTTLTATISPSNTTNKTVTWTTSNATVATVSNGKITAKSVGTATITAKTTNGKTATCTVTVKAVEADSVKLSVSATTLKVGDTTTLTATITPTNANGTITWTTSNATVATVSNGKITAKSVGTATITAKTTNGKTATCTVTVKAIEAESISISASSNTINVGDKVTVSATILPSNTADKSVTWTTSNSSIASISTNGLLTAVKSGSVTITAKTSNGKTSSYTFTVKDVDAESIAVSATSKTVEIGESITIYATISPSNTTNKSVTWTTSNSSVVTVSGGKITAKAAGTATITVKTTNGKTATCKITVPEVAVTSISLSSTTKSLDINDSFSLTATLSPTNAGNKDVTWISNNSSVATVDTNGKVTAKAVGNATITAKTSNGKISNCVVTVIDPENLTFEFSSEYTRSCYTMYKGTSETLKHNELPKGVDIKWVSYNPDIISIDSSGKVTAIGIGSSKITATLPNGKTDYVFVSSIYTEEQKESVRKEFAEEVLYYCNLERAKEGLEPLQLMDDLSYLAQIRSEEQAVVRDISHTRPDGTKWSTVFQYANISKKACGENLLISGGYSAKSCVTMWMESPGHRANIMRKNFTHMGVGVVFTSDFCTGAYISTQLFIQA